MTYFTMGTRIVREFLGGDHSFKGIRHGEVVGGVSNFEEGESFDILWDDDRSSVDRGYIARDLRREILPTQQTA